MSSLCPSAFLCTLLQRKEEGYSFIRKSSIIQHKVNLKQLAVKVLGRHLWHSDLGRREVKEEEEETA